MTWHSYLPGAGARGLQSAFTSRLQKTKVRRNRPPHLPFPGLRRARLRSRHCRITTAALRRRQQPTRLVHRRGRKWGREWQWVCHLYRCSLRWASCSAFPRLLRSHLCVLPPPMAGALGSGLCVCFNLVLLTCIFRPAPVASLSRPAPCFVTCTCLRQRIRV